MNKHKQSGFGVVGALVVLIALAAAGAAGYVVYAKTKGKPQTSDITAETASPKATSPYADWVTYTNAKLGFSIDHPKDWLISETNDKTNTAFKRYSYLDYFAVNIQPKLDKTTYAPSKGVQVVVANVTAKLMTNIIRENVSLPAGDGTTHTPTISTAPYTIGSREATRLDVDDMSTLLVEQNIDAQHVTTYGLSGLPAFQSKNLDDAQIKHAIETFRVLQ